ncbi:ameloblastin [Urocitellus parryii]
MSASKISFFKMKDLILILCLLEMSFAVPMFPQQPGAPGMAPGMASLSLETMRQLGSLQGLNALSQFSRFGFGKSLNSLWLHGLLPPHSSLPWLRPTEHETQQYEYSLPVHPPPLPSQPSLQPQQSGLKPFLQPTAATAIQATAQKGGPQPPMHPRQLPLQDGEPPATEQEVAPTEKPPTSKLYPGMFYTSYGTNQLNAPTRLGMMSSEEMEGGRGGPMGYGAMFPGFGGLRHSLRRMSPNPAMGGDFTLEFDSPAGTKGPEKGEGEAQASPMQEANPANPKNPALLSQIAPGAHAGLLAFPNDNIPNLARGPARQRKGPLGVTPSAADPLMTPELAEVYETYGADVTTPLDTGEATMDTTMTPDTQQTSMPGNKVHQPQMVHDAWRFHEP